MSRLARRDALHNNSSRPKLEFAATLGPHRMKLNAPGLRRDWRARRSAICRVAETGIRSVAAPFRRGVKPTTVDDAHETGDGRRGGETTNWM